MDRNFFLLIVLILLLPAFTATAQEIEIKLGPGEISYNELFTITLTVHNERLRNYDKFPEIPGFIKRGTSSATSTNIINNQVSSTQSITQNYMPQREGTFVLKPFSMEVNGKSVKSNGKTIKVGPPVQTRRNQNPFDPFGTDPFGDFFGNENEPTEFLDIKEDAFLAVTTDKDEVYLGEGFTMELAFYVAETNNALLDFYELGKQLGEITKKLKQGNTWEENFNIEDVTARDVVVNGKRYNKYPFFKATFYPLNLQPIKFPKVGMEFIKYKVAKNPSFFGRQKQEDFKTFYTQPKEVKVKDLPPHQLKDQVSVGNFKLFEKIDKKNINTGESFQYLFEVRGEGNISAIREPVLKNDGSFEFYPPNIKQNVNRTDDKVFGSRSFNYYGIPNEPGNHRLADFFNWIYFNPRTAKYDTLKSQIELNVTGESKKNQSITSNDQGSFYDRIELASNDLQKAEEDRWLKILANIFILTMLVAAAVFLIKK